MSVLVFAAAYVGVALAVAVGMLRRFATHPHMCGDVIGGPTRGVHGFDDIAISWAVAAFWPVSALVATVVLAHRLLVAAVTPRRPR